MVICYTKRDFEILLCWRKIICRFNFWKRTKQRLSQVSRFPRVYISPVHSPKPARSLTIGFETSESAFNVWIKLRNLFALSQIFSSLLRSSFADRVSQLLFAYLPSSGSANAHRYDRTITFLSRSVLFVSHSIAQFVEVDFRLLQLEICFFDVIFRFQRA